MVETGDGFIEIEVVYASRDRQTIIPLRVPCGTDVMHAIESSGIAVIHPELKQVSCAVGVFGRRVTMSEQLDCNDRVEIYRPLSADPKQARHNRAKSSTGPA